MLMGLITLTPLAQARAGGESSGGGNAVVCFAHPAIADRVRANGGVIQDAELEHINFIEMVDLYQARKPRGFPPRAPEMVPISNDERIDDAQAISEFFQRIEKRMESVSNEQRDTMRGLREEVMVDEALRFHSNPVRQTRDADLEIELNSPACTFTTMAYNEIITERIVYIHFDERLFNLKNTHTSHSRLSKAVLIMHEFFYLVARYQHPEVVSSKKTRDFLGYLITQNTGMKVLRFLETADELGFGKNPEIDYEFSSKGLGIRYTPLLGSVPAYEVVRFLVGLGINISGAVTVPMPIEEYLNATYDKYLGDTYDAFNLALKVEPSLKIGWGLNGAIATLEALLGERYVDNSARKYVQGDDEIKARTLLAKLRPFMVEGQRLAREAQSLRLAELREKLLKVPYLDSETVQQVMRDSEAAMNEAIELYAKLPIVKSQSQLGGYDLQDFHSAFQHPFIESKVRSATSSLHTALRNALLPDSK